MEHHWFEPSRMHLKYLILFFLESNCKINNKKSLHLIVKIMSKFNIQKTITSVEKQFQKPNLPVLKIGDNIKIGVKIIEGNRERIQFYEGTIIVKKNNSINTTITVRKTLQGIGIERIFLIHSPKIDSIQVLRSSKVRRSKLYYLRNLKGKASRLKQAF